MNKIIAKARAERARFRLSKETFHKLSAALTLLILIFIFSFGNAAFLSVNNGLTVLLQTSVIGLLGIGILAANRDLVTKDNIDTPVAQNVLY